MMGLLQKLYSFGFNGKEKINEVYGDGNAYDFGARVFDPRVGRFFLIDPRTFEYPYFSPYLFANNNPIRLIDYNGEGPEDPIMKTILRSNGTYQGTLVMGNDKGFSTSQDGKKQVNLTAWGTQKILDLQSQNKVEMRVSVIVDNKGNYGFFLHDPSKNTYSSAEPVPEQISVNKSTSIEIDGNNYKVVATVHSQPDPDSRPSPQDAQCAQTEGVPNYVVTQESISRVGSYNEWYYGATDKGGTPYQNNPFKVAKTSEAIKGDWNIIDDIKNPQKTKAQENVE